MATHKQSQNLRTPERKATDALEIARYWNAGDAGCGALILGLKQEMDRIEAGELLEVAARDAAAPIDLLAWCQMTANTLVAEDHSTYVLKKRTVNPTINQ